MALVVCNDGKRKSSNAELDFTPPFAVRFDSNLPAVQQIDTVITVNKKRKNVKYRLLPLPLYLVERLNSLVSGCF